MYDTLAAIVNQNKSDFCKWSTLPAMKINFQILSQNFGMRFFTEEPSIPTLHEFYMVKVRTFIWKFIGH